MNAILGHVFGGWKQPMQIGCYGMECRDRFAPINIVYNNNQSAIFSSTERFLFIFWTILLSVLTQALLPKVVTFE